ncbi:hypothetical protein [Actinophytocola sp.]|uniref:hypothetical protein n=1 Tax=Actinophytocola sp. TaxID=1872138 RepID=UPI003D6B2451
MSAIAFQLGNTCERYGSLEFPRLAIGRLIMGAELPDSRQKARAEVQRLLSAHVDIDAIRPILLDTAGALAPLLTPNSAAFQAAARLGIEGMLRWIRHARALSPDWYAHQDRGLRRNPLDALVELNSWTQDGLTRQVNELLWDAFLADLRHDFQKSKHAFEMTLNCVVLLDNADTPLGQDFVNGLVEARKGRQVRGMDSADPMTTVATSRGELLTDVPRHEVVEYAGAEIDDPLSADGNDEPTRWCRYVLRDLSERETGVLVSALPPNPDANAQSIANHQVTSMVYGLIGGHPASTALLVDAMREHPLEHGDTLTRLLDLPEPGRDPDRPPLGERLRQRLLGEFTEDTYEDLVTCAAARTEQHARLLAARGDLLTGGVNSYREIAPVLWPASGGAGPTVLRRLLLRELATRADDEAANWTKVNDWFRTRCYQDRDVEGVLHYAMAGGDIATASEGLRLRLTHDSADWVQLLRSITTVPRRPTTDSAASPMDQLRATLDRRSQRLTRLIVARWIAYDPFISNRRRALHLQIAADYDFVAGLAEGDPGPLLTEANHHRQQAELWS